MIRPQLRAALVLGLGALVVHCQATGQASQTEPKPAPRRPNILFLLTDDMDMSALPHMAVVKKELIDAGTTFSSAFVTDPVCCPSRASILTGLYVHNHGVLDNKPPIGGYRKFFEGQHEKDDIAIWMKGAGYHTGLVGKYLNRYPGWKWRDHVPPGWDEWHALFFPETYYNYEVLDNEKVHAFGENTEEYQTDVLAARALDFVHGADPGVPLFLYLAPFAPHAPAEPAPRHENLFPGLKAPRPPSFNEEDVSDKPAWVRFLPRIAPQTIPKIDDWHRRRVQSLQAVDEMLAKLLEALKAKGMLDNTYIFFMSDNGFQLGAHRFDHGKADPYEESIHVPLIVRGPGVPAGRILPHFVLNIDLASTFVELAGGKTSRPVDGRSLVALLGDQPPDLKDWRKDFLVEHWDSGKQRETDNNEADGAVPAYHELRTNDYAYIEYPKTAERELYDLRKDPYEMQSLHKQASRDLLQQLSTRLAALVNCRGENCK